MILQILIKLSWSLVLDTASQINLFVMTADLKKAVWREKKMKYLLKKNIMPKKVIQSPQVSYGDGQKVLKCSICSRSFLTLQGLDKHCKSAHEKRVEQKSSF